MAKQLTSNVEVDGVWYGPSYPNNEPTEAVLERITNPAAFEPAPGGGRDLRFTSADFAVEAGEQPHLRGAEDAAAAEAFAMTAAGAAGGPGVEAPAKSASKGEWVDYAVAQGADRDEAEAATKDDLVDRYGD